MTTQIWNTGDIPVFTIGDRLRKARERVGLSQSDFAAEIDVSPRSVSNYESEAVTPKKIVLKAWALRTGVPLEWIETGEVPNNGDGGDGASMVNYYYLPKPRLLAVA